MAHNAYLASNHAIAAYFGRACHTRLGCNYRIFSYLYIVAYLYQVIQLNSFMYNGGTHSSPVDSGIRAYFHIVFNNHIAYLRHFAIVVFVIGYKSESVRAYYYTRMQGAVVAYNRIVVYLDT